MIHVCKTCKSSFIPLEVAAPRSTGLAIPSRARLLTGLTTNLSYSSSPIKANGAPDLGSTTITRSPDFAIIPIILAKISGVIANVSVEYHDPENPSILVLFVLSPSYFLLICFQSQMPTRIRSTNTTIQVMKPNDPGPPIMPQPLYPPIIALFYNLL